MQSLHLFMKEKNSRKSIRTPPENSGCIDSIEIYPLYASDILLLSAKGTAESGKRQPQPFD
jgi:hypothetical protein